MGCNWSMCQNLNTLDGFWINQVHMRQVVLGPWLMLGSLQLDCARVLHEKLFVPVLMYGSETML